MSSRYKVLPLQSHFVNRNNAYWADWRDCLDKENKIKPVFNKEAWYYDRWTKRAWVELGEDGAYLYDTDMFLYLLENNEGNNVPHPDAMAAYKYLIREGLASKEQKRLYYNEIHRRELVNTWRNAALSTAKILGGVKKRRKNKKKKKQLQKSGIELI